MGIAQVKARLVKVKMQRTNLNWNQFINTLEALPAESKQDILLRVNNGGANFAEVVLEATNAARHAKAQAAIDAMTAGGSITLADLDNVLN